MVRRITAFLAAVIFIALLAACDDSSVTPSGSNSSEASASVESNPHSTSSQTLSSQASSTGSSQSGSSVSQPELFPQSKMTKLTAFYASVQAACVYTVDISQADADTVAMLRCLQGLLAGCNSAALYLEATESDKFWHRYCNSEIGVYFQSATAEAVVSKYMQHVKGLVVYTPETFEYTVALNLANKNGYLAVSAAVADKYFASVTNRLDIRGNYMDKQSAYKAMLESVGKDFEYISLTGEGAAFADYTFAVRALHLELSHEIEWERELLCDILEWDSWQLPAVAFCDESDSQMLKLLSERGFGLLNVNGFSNATVLSSIPTGKKHTPQASTVGTAGVSGTAYITFCMNSASLGSTLNSDYTVWTNSNDSFPTSYIMSSAVAELAPVVAMWYNSNSVNNNRVVARGYTEIDERAMPYELYCKWHSVNNALMSGIGVKTAVTPTLREDIAYGENYGEWSDAEAIIVADSSGDGRVWASHNTPVIATVNIKTLSGLNRWLTSLKADDRRPLFHIVAMDSSVFTGTVITGTSPGGTVTMNINDIVKLHTGTDSDFKLASVENLFEYARLYENSTQNLKTAD